ncbi:MAG: hypothetical protein Q4A54_07565 [Parabacteroides sp.]|nr:hypothetical protein [Parabacteroides sp.]
MDIYATVGGYSTCINEAYILRCEEFAFADYFFCSIPVMEFFQIIINMFYSKDFSNLSSLTLPTAKAGGFLLL